MFRCDPIASPPKQFPMKTLIRTLCSTPLLRRVMDTLSAPILVSIYISTPCVACATSAERLDHLDPVNLEESKAYRTKLEKLLFVTEANYGRMSFNPGSDPEFVVSIYW